MMIFQMYISRNNNVLTNQGNNNFFIPCKMINFEQFYLSDTNYFLTTIFQQLLLHRNFHTFGTPALAVTPVINQALYKAAITMKTIFAGIKEM